MGQCSYYGNVYKLTIFSATDPADKIYALLGLCPQDFIVDVDYSKTAVEVYRELAEGLLFRRTVYTTIDSKCVFHILGQSQGRGTLPPPSWVRHWSISADIHLASLGLMHLHTIAREGCHKAAGDSKVEISRRGDPDKLCLSGKAYDTVQTMSSIDPTLTHNEFDETSLASLAKRYNNYDELGLDSLTLSHWINESSSIASTCLRYSENRARDMAYCVR